MWSVPNAYIKLPSQLTTYLCPLSLMLVCVESTAVVVINANDPRSAMCSPALTSLSTTTCAHTDSWQRTYNSQHFGRKRQLPHSSLVPARPL